MLRFDNENSSAQSKTVPDTLPKFLEKQTSRNIGNAL